MWKRLVLTLTLPGAVAGQSEQALREYFEGKQVRVKMDMPATKDGVDYHYGQKPPVDFKSYSTRIKNQGVSLRQGDTVMVTTVKVKDTDIEFQLGGGGYGTARDERATVSMPMVAKSSRETDIEKRLKTETDARMREQLNRELSTLERNRQRENSRREIEKRRLEEIKKVEIHEKALQAGSRFNLWFHKGYLKESVPTPEDVMRLLDEYVDFSGLDARRPAAKQ